MPSRIPTRYRNAAATNTVILVAAGNYAVVGWNLINNNADAAYLKIFNSATAGAVTLGSTEPVRTLLIPPGGTALLSNEDKLNVSCPLGIVVAVTKSMADSATDAPTAVCYVELSYDTNQ